MTRLREGDVVADCGGAERVVIEARYPEYKDTAPDVKVPTGMSWRWLRHETLTLLRRPIRVGDVIVQGFGSAVAKPCTVKSIFSDMVMFEDGSACWIHGGSDEWSAWRHADGTEIESTPKGAKSTSTSKPTFQDLLGNPRSPAWKSETVESTLAKDPIGQAAVAAMASGKSVAVRACGSVEDSTFAAVNGDESGEWKPTAPIILARPGVTLTKAPEPLRQPAAHMFAAPCRCGHTTKHSLGTLDPKEGRCTHSWRFDRWGGAAGGYECTNCGLWIDQRALAYASDGATTLLSDEARHARILFETDPDVIAYVRSRSDDMVPLRETRWNTALGRSETVAKGSDGGWQIRMGGVTKHEPGKAPVRVSGPARRDQMQIAWNLGEAGNKPDATKARRESTEAKLWKRAVDRAAAMHEKAGRR